MLEASSHVGCRSFATFIIYLRLPLLLFRVLFASVKQLIPSADMQPSYGLPQTTPHQHQHEQTVPMDIGVCSSSLFSISNPLYQPQKQPQNLFQLLQQHHHHQLQPFQQQDPFFPLNFKLGLNDNATANKEALLTQQFTSSFLQGAHSVAVVPPPWNPQEDSAAIKEPIWKPLEKEVINSGNIECNDNKEQEMEGKNGKKSAFREVDESSGRRKNLENKCRLFGELEAIYSRANIGELNNQTGSGSALTGQNSPTIQCSNNHCENVDAGIAGAGVDPGSDISIGREASLWKTQKRKKKKKRNLREHLGSMTGFFEMLVKQVMDHQEGLQRKFMEAIEGIEKERTRREDSWRRQQVEKHNREAIARAHEQAVASNREAIIISYIEKITGQSLNLPCRNPPMLFQPEIKRPKEPVNADSNSRWLKAEVEALIEVRSSLETRFQEPGVKAPVWEEVSSLMASMGYQRNAKRCKEKWENINKYFRKAKESGRSKLSLNSKTCPYFDKLDQLYFSTPLRRFTKSDDEEAVRQGYSEVSDALVSGKESGNSEYGEMGSSKLNLDGIADEEESQEKENLNHEYGKDSEQEDCRSDDDDDGEE